MQDTLSSRAPDLIRPSARASKVILLKNPGFYLLIEYLLVLSLLDLL